MSFSTWIGGPGQQLHQYGVYLRCARFLASKHEIEEFGDSWCPQLLAAGFASLQYSSNVYQRDVGDLMVGNDPINSTVLECVGAALYAALTRMVGGNVEHLLVFVQKIMYQTVTAVIALARHLPANPPEALEL
jgi:hypothetical protein